MIRTVCNCDTCGTQIDITNGDHPACINASAPTPASIGKQPEESHLCDACWVKLCELFPRFKEAERFAVPVPVPPAQPAVPAALDSVSPEHLVMLFAKAMGVQVTKTDDDLEPPQLVKKTT